jgi:bifunctional non-homologous end joining protein LigD
MAQVLLFLKSNIVSMSLSLYKKKRRFEETPEPEGKEKSSAKGLRFVIQKHDASHLHYDFRLEMKGVLKSWAVPKGPSLNPADKRLAMMVEDHPYDYRNFEGIIPEGNYGGGTVIVWDEGIYEPMNGEGLSQKEKESLLLKQLYAGDLKIRMDGKKIKGNYALFRLKKDEKSWLLVKKDDEYASEEEVIKQNKSVKSGKTLAQVAKQNGVEVKHPEEDVAQSKTKPASTRSRPQTKKLPVKTVSRAATKTASRKKKLLT